MWQTLEHSLGNRGSPYTQRHYERERKSEGETEYRGTERVRERENERSLW